MPQNAINQLQTNAIAFRNLGVPKIVFVPRKMRYMFVIPKADKLTAAQVANLRTTLQSKLTDPDRSKRWQITVPIAEMVFTGEEPKPETSGYGDKRYNGEGTISYDLIFWEGGGETHKNMRALNGLADSKDLLFVDDKGRLVHNTITEPGGAWSAGGFDPSEILTPVAPFTSNDKGYATKTSVAFSDPTQFSDTLGVIDPSFSIATTIKSLMNIGLNNVTPTGATAGQVTIAPMAGGENLAVSLNTTTGNPFTSGTGTLWQAFREDTGAAVAISAASYVAGIGIRLTLTTTSIPTGTTIAISLKDNATLATAGVVGFDNNDTLYYIVP